MHGFVEEKLLQNTTNPQLSKNKMHNSGKQYVHVIGNEHKNNVLMNDM